MQFGQIAVFDRPVGTIIPAIVAPEAGPHPVAPGFSAAMRNAMAITAATPTDAAMLPASQIPIGRHSAAGTVAVLDAATLVEAAGHQNGMEALTPQDTQATAMPPPAPMADLPAPGFAEGVQTTSPQAATDPGAEHTEFQTEPAPIDRPQAETTPEAQFAAPSLDTPALLRPTATDLPSPAETPMLAAVGQQTTGDQPEPVVAASRQPVTDVMIASPPPEEPMPRSVDRSGPVRTPVPVAAVPAPAPGPADGSVAEPVAAAAALSPPVLPMAMAAQPPSAPGSARLAQVAKAVAKAGSAVSPSTAHAAAGAGITPPSLPGTARQAEPASQPGAKAAAVSVAALSSLPTDKTAVLPSTVVTPDAAALPFSPPVVAATPAVVAPDPAVIALPTPIATTPAALAHDLGLAIARQIAADGNTLHVQIDPAELGRIDVRMTFDDKGMLRAIVGAESAVSLDLLRRDSADLGRAMTDAGVRADDQSFRFEARSEGRGNEPGQPRPTPRVPMASNEPTQADHQDPTHFQPLHWRGRINVLA